MKKSHKIMLVGGGLVILFVGIFFGLLVQRNYREWVAMEALETDRHGKVADLSQKVAENERYIKLIEQDDDFREWVVRQRLGYTKKNEIVYRFED